MQSNNPRRLSARPDFRSQCARLQRDPTGRHNLTRSSNPMAVHFLCNTPHCPGSLRSEPERAVDIREPSHLLAKYHHILLRLTANGKNMHTVCLKTENRPQRLAQAGKQSKLGAGTSMHRPFRGLIHDEQQLIVCATR